MKVQSCTSCGARYNVERLPDGSTFECRRCGHKVHVAEPALPPKRFSVGLLLSGALTLVGLLLYANPEFGFGESRWPWELVGGSEAWSTQVTVILWAVVGIWAVVTSLGVGASWRSLLTLTLAGVLVLMCTSLAVRELNAMRPLHILLALIALLAGLLLSGRPDARGVARGLAFTGGLMIVWRIVLPLGGPAAIEGMIDEVEMVFRGDLELEQVLGSVAPKWALLLAGVVGLLAGLGAQGAALVWTGSIFACAFLLLPVVADVVRNADVPGHWDEPGRRIAQYGTGALVSSGLVLWVLSANALADLIRNRKETS